MPGTAHEMSYNQAYGTAHEMSYNQAYNTTTSFMVQNKDTLDPDREYETMDGARKMDPPPPYTQVVEGENQRSSGIYETIPVDNPLYDNWWSKQEQVKWFNNDNNNGSSYVVLCELLAFLSSFMHTLPPIDFCLLLISKLLSLILTPAVQMGVHNLKVISDTVSTCKVCKGTQESW